MAFLEITFPACPSFGNTAEPRYSVTVIERASGIEKRNQNWDRPLQRYTITVGPRAEDDISELLEFWHVVGGRYYGFRFKDFADYKSCRVENNVSSIDQPLVLLTGSPSGYQLTKRYTYGGYTQDREILKPKQGTILIADGGTLKTEGTHYTIDYTSGIVQILFSPSGTLTWGGEFDVPCRFDSEFPVEILDQRVQSVSISLVELRDENA